MLFKFTTTKPSAVEIWNTLSSYDFKPDQGYTADQIRFICYCIFQLKDFKESKNIINKYLNGIGNLSTLVMHLQYVMSCTGIITVQLPPADFPHFVDKDLYIPYYMFMQLIINVDSDLWISLFDRDKISENEYDYIVANSKPIAESITMYKLWQLSPSLDSIFKAFAIDESKSPVVVVDRKDVENDLQKYIHQYLEDTPIYNYSLPIQIPSFKLRSADVPS